MPRGNPKNFEKDIIRTSDEAARRGRNGGIKSGKARKEKASMKHAAQTILNAAINAQNVKTMLKSLNLPESEHTVRMAIFARMALDMISGKYRGADLLFTIAGAIPDKNNKQSDDPPPPPDLSRLTYEELVRLSRLDGGDL